MSITDRPQALKSAIAGLQTIQEDAVRKDYSRVAFVAACTLRAVREYWEVEGPELARIKTDAAEYARLPWNQSEAVRVGEDG